MPKITTCKASYCKYNKENKCYSKEITINDKGTCNMLKNKHNCIDCKWNGLMTSVCTECENKDKWEPKNTTKNPEITEDDINDAMLQKCLEWFNEPGENQTFDEKKHPLRLCRRP